MTKGFELVSKYEPAGDQPKAIEALVDGLESGLAQQTLLGVTGSGKTFTMANIINQVQRPTLVLAHNKTLAAQLYGEMKEFFPNNAVEYFVSYYDYYQPEAYVPSTDTFIEKDASINDHIEQMRLSATKALMERRDVVIVASVSAIYGLGDPESYMKMLLHLRQGDTINQRDILRRLADPEMGIGGAALSTLISWIICSIWILYLLAKQRGYILPRLLTPKEFMVSSRSILHIALPAAGANMLTPIAGAILTRVVAGYGEEAVAAWGVGSRLESFTTILVLALSMTLPPFISQNLGANKFDRVKQAYWLAVKFVMGWQLLVSILLWLLSGLIAALFAKEQAVAELIQLFLLIVPFGYGLQGIIILTNSSLNACHLPMSALTLSIIRLFVFFVPITVAMGWVFDLTGIFAGAVAANLCMAMVSMYWFRRSLRVLETQTD